MGHSASSLKTSAQVSVLGGSSGVDAIELSYRRSSCCGRKWKKIASFSFPREGRSSDCMVGKKSSNVANLPLKKLREKDGETPVKITCLAGGLPAFRTELTVSDLLHRLERTRQGKSGHLFFSLAVGAVQDTEPKAPAFVALFCNGQRCGDKHAAHPVDSSGQQKDGQEQEIENDGIRQEVMPLEAPCRSDMENVPSGHYSQTKECEGTNTDPPAVLQVDEMSNVYTCFTPDGVKQGVASPVPNTSQKVVRNRRKRHRKSGKISKGNVPESSDFGDTRDRNAPRKEGSARGSLWDLVADCAGVAAVVLCLYNVWVEYDSYW